MVKPNMSRAESAGTSNHPLVSMLFWLVGKKSGDEDEEAEETHSRHSKSFDGHEMGDDVGDHSGGDPGSGSDGGRTLSWRDERSDEAIAVREYVWLCCVLYV